MNDGMGWDEMQASKQAQAKELAGEWQVVVGGSVAVTIVWSGDLP
jgi:hypothetical protein